MTTVETPQITSQPNPTEEYLLSGGLDYYKPTMSQLAYEQEPNAEVTFTFHNRGQQRLMDYVDPKELQTKLDSIRERGWTKSELAYLGRITINGNERAFSDDYLEYLEQHKLPEITVSHDKEIDDLAIETTGPHALATFWETIAMSEVSETYFENYLLENGINPTDVYEEGDRRLSETIEVLKARPNIKIADFGTRRRFSAKWHEHVVRRLATECPDNLLGTSNVGLAQKYGLKPIGTFAHEMPMVQAGLADARGEDIRDSHNKFLESWFDRYGKEYSIALTDTFGSDFFLEDFTPEQATEWRGVRQDSGDPFAFGDKMIDFYHKSGVDPRTKTLIFSDSLDINKIANLHEYFDGKIGDTYGIGTKLTNNLGQTALNFVMKATRVRLPATGQEAGTVKLSDDQGKHTGDSGQVKRYQKIFKTSV